MTKAFALNFSMKALFFIRLCEKKRDRLNLLDSLFYTICNEDRMCTKNECIAKLRENLPDIQKEFGVKGLCLFGSVALGENGPDSDVDILVDMPPKFVKLIRQKEYLESLVNATVDLIHHHSNMNPRFLNEISKDGITIL